jgi:hypothetical protein
MVQGLDIFRKHFKEHQGSYILIGGVACYLHTEEAGVNFRATKDLDIVLCAEALNTEFVSQFWAFVKAGGYEHIQKSTGEKQFYRFEKPTSNVYPYMLELFSRTPDAIDIPDDATISPIPVDDDISSLSAILLDDDYYQCILKGKSIINDIPVLGVEYIIPFKAKAWVDMTERKNNGESIDSKKINKHRNDAYRMSVLLSPSQKVELLPSIANDLRTFVEAQNNATDDLKPLKLGTDKETMLSNLESIYQL